MKRFNVDFVPTLRIAACALAWCGSLSAHALEPGFPSRAVTFIIPYAAGGGTDVIGRTLASEASSRLKQPVVVENKPGATGNIGMAAGARAAPDGYTLTMVASNLVTNPYVYPKMEFDVLRDLAPVTMIATFSSVTLVNPALPIRTVGELVAYARANPEKFFIGTAGLGSSSHLAGALLAQATGIKPSYVPYKGEAPALAGLLAGEVQATFVTINSALPQMQSGRVRAIALAANKRAPQLPDLPAMSDAIPGFDASGWFAIMVPGKTAPDVVQFYNRELRAVLENAGVKKKLIEGGYDPINGTPEAFAAFIRTELDKYGKLIKEIGLKLE